MAARSAIRLMGGADIWQRSLSWMRANLFSSPLNTVITLVCIYVIWQLVGMIVNWGIINASFSADRGACEQFEGACWAYIPANFRFIIFGIYPEGEQWRSLLGSAMLLGGMLVTMDRRVWTLWLPVGWIVGLVAFFIIMHGGVFGLTVVRTPEWGGLTLTLMLSIVGIGFAGPLALLLALGRRSDMPFVKVVCIVFIEVFRGVPLISVLIMASVMFPLFLPEGVTVNKLLRAQVGIIFFQGAYLAEVFRGGMQSVPEGQYEAADSLGLTYWQKMGRIILPQALRIVIPPTMSTFISLTKDTTLVTIIGLFDLLGTTKSAINEPAWRQQFVEGYVFIAFIYFCFCFTLSRYALYLDRELKRGMAH